MNSKYLRLPQDASNLLYSGNEKGGTSHRPQSFSRSTLILSLSSAANVFLFVWLLLLLREKPTPTSFGENGGGGEREAQSVCGKTFD